MNLIREHWTKADISEFKKYLLKFSKGKEKGEWEQRIVNTKLSCIAVPANVVKNIIKQIAKGNFREFLQLNIPQNFTEKTINGNLICLIKDFDEMKVYLDNYLSTVDNWASVDTLKFKVNSHNAENYLSLAREYVKSPLTFVRRCGLIILFKLVSNDEYIDDIFSIMNSLNSEIEYYVNMANAWLFAECFAKQREATLKFLKTHNMNDFSINMGIQKCRDSFRISSEDKKMLLQFKRKTNGKKYTKSNSTN